MNKLVLDTSAWIEYLEGTEKGTKIKDLLEQPNNIFLTTGLIIAEIAAKHLKEHKECEQQLIAIQALSSIVPFDAQLGKEAAKIYLHHRKSKNKFGLVDAHVVAAARLNNAKVLACDNDFRGIPEAIVV